MTRRWRVLAVLVALATLLGACTGIPDSSAPSTVETVHVDDGAGVQATQPQPDALPRTIVSDFLDDNAVESAKHTAARAFLTPTARNQWSDQRVTVIADRQIGTYDAEKRSLTVTGRVVGTIDANGIYTPSLLGTGDGGKPMPFPFTLSQVSGQYRIDQLRSGLLITVDQFLRTYQQHILYFYDLADRYLVPDVRWSSIPSTDDVALATWLLDLLVAAPRPDLQDVLSTDTFPAQADANHVMVRSSGGDLTIEIPGSSQLDPSAQNRLAVQLSETFGDALPVGSLTVTDGGAPVTIPVLGATAFTAQSFTAPTAPTPPETAVYYLRDGRIVDENGKAISGPLGNGSTYLNSIAVTRLGSAQAQLSVAATQGTGNSQRLVVGNQTSGVAQTTVHGALTRPIWAPGLSEVWVGVGSTIHRLTVSGRTATDSVVQMPPTAGGGRVVSIHFSPDGSRLAVVIAGSSGSSQQLYIGAVVRDAGSVRLSSLEQVSPAGVVVTDADWSSVVKLIVIGYLASSLDGGSYETGVDGSSWKSKGIVGLPSPPVSVTASVYGVPWVESDGQVWEESGSLWTSASPTGQAYGNKPVYLS